MNPGGGAKVSFSPRVRPAGDRLPPRPARNAMVLLDLVNCRSGYSPTHFQRELFPAELRHKIAVIFDGIETDVFHRRPDSPAAWATAKSRHRPGSSPTSAAASSRCAGSTSS